MDYLVNVFVPYAKLERATRLALSNTRFKAVETVAAGSYVDYLAERWRDGATFINVEHDAVPWPGAIRKLWECPHAWCAYGHTEEVDFAPGTGYETSLHCCKFSASLIAATPDAVLSKEDDGWGNLATHMTVYLQARGFRVHQHYPPVNNLGRAL